MGYQQILRKFERGDDLFAAYAGEVVQKLRQGVARFEVVQQRLDRNPRADENGRPAQDIGIGMNDLSCCRHRGLRCDDSTSALRPFHVGGMKGQS
jgi:hypothetical protein